MEITGDLVKNLTDPSVVSICKQLLLETEPDDGRYYITAFFIYKNVKLKLIHSAMNGNSTILSAMRHTVESIDFMLA